MGRKTDHGAKIIPFRRPPVESPQYYPAVVHWLERLERYLTFLKSGQPKMADIAFEYPSTDPSIIVTRSFNAPLALVWRAFTDPVHVARWWGPESRSPVRKIISLDLRPGGEWRYLCLRHDGVELVFHGRYLEIVPMEKIVNSFGLEGAFPADEATPETHLFSETAGRTYYRSVSLTPSFAARQAMADSGMESGARESLEQLGNVVDSLFAEASA